MKAKLRKLREMWGRDRATYFLWRHARRSGEVGHSIFRKGEKAAIVLIDEDDRLAAEVKDRMLKAGVDVINDIEEGVRRGFFKA
jgi:hypothetical protein